jgi:hypothetical protein
MDSEVVLEPLGMRAPQHLFTPPYLTCLPEVFYHQLTINDRFLVLATDGSYTFDGFICYFNIQIF